MKKFENQLDRMRSMMNYGLQTESKKDFSGLEYKKEGPDGKTYGIIREGAKFYIKSADKKGKVLKEDFNYIGGFANRKNHEYSSFAVAQKQFDLVMASLQEVHNKKGMIVESWNPAAREYVKVEATQKMKDEIARQRQIMQRAALISENKVYDIHEDECKGKGCCKVDQECADTQKKNIKQEKHQTGSSKKVNGDPYTKKPEMKDLKEEETLAWNDNYDYLDKSSGTEIGDSAPFDESPNSEKEMKNGVVEEGEAMHNTDNQNSPKPGVGEIGDDAPFDKPVNEEKDFFHNPDVSDEDQLPSPPEEINIDMDEDEDFEEDFEDADGDEIDIEGEDFDDDEDFDDLASDDDEIEYEDEFEGGDVEERLASLENTINAIADKLGVSDFDDDEPLYDDEEEEVEDNFEGEEDFDGEDFDDDEEEDDFTVIESRDYKRVMAEARLNDFGKHPAYRKTPMQLPPNTNHKFDGYYDMNDDCVENDAPFGQQIGSGAPFEIDPQSISNAIAESLIRTLRNKKKR